MTNARKTLQRLRAGTFTSADLGSTYEIGQLATQSDQTSGIPWIIAADGTTTPTPARITTNADLSRSPDGFYSWSWRMSYFTFGMTDFWLTTFLPGGVFSAPVTVMTYDEADGALFLNATIWRPTFPSDKAQNAPAGFGNIVWDFTRGVIIAPPAP